MASKHLVRAILVAIFAVAALAAEPEFEVASIKPAVTGGSAIAPGPVRATLQYTASGLSAQQTLRALIAEAYQVPQSRVTELGESYKKILDRLYDRPSSRNREKTFA